MAKTTYRSTGKIKLENDTHWDDVILEVLDSLSSDVGSFSLENFECVVSDDNPFEDGDDGHQNERYYFWKAEGKIL